VGDAVAAGIARVTDYASGAKLPNFGRVAELDAVAEVAVLLTAKDRDGKGNLHQNGARVVVSEMKNSSLVEDAGDQRWRGGAVGDVRGEW
jgi:hypothetical protein